MNSVRNSKEELNKEKNEGFFNGAKNLWNAFFGSSEQAPLTETEMYEKEAEKIGNNLMDSLKSLPKKSKISNTEIKESSKEFKNRLRDEINKEEKER